MKVKFEYFILIGVIAALAIYLSMRNTDRTLYELPVIPEVTANEFTKIEITHKAAAITLEKIDESWQIQPQGYPVDPGRIEAILATVSTLKTTALASEAKDYQRYELDDERKIEVKAWTGGDLKREFEIGKVAPSFRHTFIKLGDDPRVFHARDNFRKKFDQENTVLQDKTILRLDLATVDSFKIETSDGPTEFKRQAEADDKNQKVKKPSIWQRSDGQLADPAAVDKLLGSAADLKCQMFIDNLSKQDLKNPIFTLVLNDADSRTLSIFAKQQTDAKAYPATSSTRAFPFFLESNLAEQIMQQPNDLMPKATDDKEEKQL